MLPDGDSPPFPLGLSIGQGRPQSIVEAFLARADVRVGGSRAWDIQVHDQRFFRRVLAKGDLGFGESYMDAQWSCERPDEMAARLFSAGLHQTIRHPLEIVDQWIARAVSRQSRNRVRREVAPHYDLGNDLFEAMLDKPYMVYTCGYWRGGARTLEAAQLAKLDLICRKLTLEPGLRVLDIGCGWGGFARFAAERYGVHVTGITLSREQARLAADRVAGLPVDIRVQDYRDVTAAFDRVVSIGCLEHVGHRNHRRFFEVVHAALAGRGYALVHAVGLCRTQYRTGRFMDRYVFPLVNPPSIAQIGRAIDGLFVLEDAHNIGTDYDRTMLEWNARFQSAWPDLHERYGRLVDGRFKRMFEFYLLMTAGFFRSRQAQVWQMVLTPPEVAPPACRCT
jgi:cyclopropane-fatty-acyl-phospholipid synthase